MYYCVNNNPPFWNMCMCIVCLVCPAFLPLLVLLAFPSKHHLHVPSFPSPYPHLQRSIHYVTVPYYLLIVWWFPIQTRREEGTTRTGRTRTRTGRRTLRAFCCLFLFGIFPSPVPLPRTRYTSFARLRSTHTHLKAGQGHSMPSCLYSFYLPLVSLRLRWLRCVAGRYLIHYLLHTLPFSLWCPTVLFLFWYTHSTDSYHAILCCYTDFTFCCARVPLLPCPYLLNFYYLITVRPTGGFCCNARAQQRAINQTAAAAAYITPATHAQHQSVCDVPWHSPSIYQQQKKKKKKTDEQGRRFKFVVNVWHLSGGQTFDDVCHCFYSFFIHYSIVIYSISILSMSLVKMNMVFLRA